MEFTVSIGEQASVSVRSRKMEEKIRRFRGQRRLVSATAISSRFDYEGGKGGDIASSVCAQTRAVSFIYLSACSPVFYLPIIFRPRNTVYVTTVTIPLFELLLLEREKLIGLSGGLSGFARTVRFREFPKTVGGWSGSWVSPPVV